VGGEGSEAKPDRFKKTSDSRQEKTMAEDQESGASGLGWFLAGLGIGALVGVLYAPKAGKETRDDLINGAVDAKEKAAEMVEQGKQKAAEYVEQGKQYVEQGKQLATEYVEQGKQKAAEIIEQGKQQAKESVEKGREYYDKGRTQWTQYVEKGKGAVQAPQAKVSAAVDAGTDAYVNTTVETPV
jgi:gas vesicle protein